MRNPSASRPLRVGMVQDGSRLHYQVPVALHKAGLLDRVFTDWYAGPGTLADWAGRGVGVVRPALGRKMRERWAYELEGVPIHTPSTLSLAHRLSRWRYADPLAWHMNFSERFGRWLLGGGRLDGLDVLVGFIPHLHPVAIEGAKARGLVVVADQVIVPTTVELREARIQAERWPGWEAGVKLEYSPLAEWEERAWPLLDHITCGSEYVKTGLMSQGVPADKVTVIPYPNTPATPPNRGVRTGPITVGFVGRVDLRKGAPYFFSVAKRFDPAKVKFVMVGPVLLPPEVVAREKGPVELVGSVPRSVVKEWLAKFDVFFFPSTCEGSAGAVVEALGTGLPVVTSPNSGSTVRDGVEGFVAAYDDTDRFAECIGRLASDPELRATMGRAAGERHAVHHPDRYAEAVSRVVWERIPSGRPLV